MFSPIVGVIFVSLGIPWGIFSLLLIIVASIATSFTLIDLFALRSWREILMFCVVLSIFAVFFRSYSPVLEMRQDPSLYMFRALNLVNYGEIYRPLLFLKELEDSSLVKSSEFEGYAKLQNGTMYHNGKLEIDFYPGGSFLYAFLGKFDRNLVFYGPVLGSLVAVLILLFLLKQVLNNHSFSLSCIIVTTLIVSPIFVWFGRAPYTEPIAMCIYLSIGLLLNQGVKKLSRAQLIILGVTFIAGYCTRLDFVIPLYIGAFIFGQRGVVSSLAFSGISVLFIKFIVHHFWIYHDLNVGSTGLFLFIYEDVVLLVSTLSGLLFFRVFRINLDKLIGSRGLFWTVTTLCAIGALFVFRNNIVPSENFEIQMIHGKLLRSHNEDTLDRLFAVFPSFVLVMGILSLGFLLKAESLGVTSRAFLVSIALVYLSFLYESGASPQLYWNLRRHLYVLVPISMVGFGVLLGMIDVRARMIILAAAAILSLNTWFEAQQQVEFSGLDRGVKRFVAKFKEKEGDVIMYTSRIRYEISPFLSYGKYDFLPVDNLEFLSNLIDKLDENERALYVSDKKYSGAIAKNFRYSYLRMGETMESIPRNFYDRNIELYVYNARELMKNGKFTEPNL